MRRAVSKQPVPAQVYRHFAVITLIVTSLLAIFSSGERSEAIAEQVKIHQQKKAFRDAEAAKKGSKPVGTSNFNAGKGRSIDDSSPDVGPSEPDRPTSDSIGWAAAPPPPTTFDGMDGPGGPEGQAGAGPGIDRSKIGPGGAPTNGQTKPKAKAKAPRKPTKEELEKMLAASRSRSGAGGAGRTERTSLGDLE